MLWLDCCGPPGSGKSTLCDPLWHPHAIITDNKLPPVEWQDFFNEITRLMHLLKDHERFIALVRMTRRTVRKMSAVSRSKEKKIYIQTGFAQRGLGIGWRLNDAGIDINELRHFFRLMPVSLGVALLEADVETVVERNHDRLNVAETAHENRDFMVPLMQPAIEIMTETLSERRVPFVRIQTNQPIEQSRAKLVKFADKRAGDAKTIGFDSKVAVCSAPIWW